MTFRESRLRSLVKSILYRVISVIGTGVLIWLATKDIEKMLSLTIAVQIFLTILYYSYERMWNKINWGRNKKGKER